jgi:hypothetical protein
MENKPIWAPTSEWKINTGSEPNLPADTMIECALWRGYDYEPSKIMTFAESMRCHSGDVTIIIMYRTVEDRSDWVVPTLDAKVSQKTDPKYQVRLLAFSGDEVAYENRAGRRNWVNAKTGAAVYPMNSEECDLVPLVEQKTVTIERWVNVYENDYVSVDYPTRREAVFRISDRSTYIATKKIVITATEGDEE